MDESDPTNPFHSPPKSDSAERHSESRQSISVSRTSSIEPPRSQSRSSSASLSHLSRQLSRSNTASSGIYGFYDSTVNLPAVLNDPRKPRQPDFLTRTWGEQFVEQPVESSSLLDNFSISDFRPYMRIVNIREALNKGTKSSPKHRRATTSSSLIPEIFSDEKFSLSNQETFRQVCPFNPRDKDALKQIKKAQETISHYLDSVEADIALNISSRTESFFSVVDNHDLLMERMQTSLTKVTVLKDALKKIRNSSVNPAMKILSSSQRKANVQRVLEKLQIISAVSQTQMTIQLLLSNGDFVGALDVINTTKEALASDLSGLVCFRHLPHQLSEVEKFIDKMMSMEFRRALSAHLNRSLDEETNSSKMLDEERFVAIVTGLLRQRRIKIVDWFREEALSALQATLKFVLISSLSHRVQEVEESTADVNDDSVLPFHLLRGLDCQGLVEHFRQLIAPLSEILIRIRVAHDVVKNIRLSSSVNQESRAGSTTEPGVSLNDISRLSLELQELLLAVAEELQELISQMLSKCPAWKEGRPPVAELCVVLYGIGVDAEKHLGVKATILLVDIQKVALAFMGKFHEQHKQKLGLLLDSERWIAAEAPANIQSLLTSILTQHSFLNIHSKRPLSQSDLTETTTSTSAIEIGGESFIVVGTSMLLIGMLAEYMSLLRTLPSASLIVGDILHKLTDLLKLFNTRSCQLVLGAEALQSAGLKNISARNMATCVRSLQLVMLFIPVCQSDFEKQLSFKQQHLLKNFEGLTKDYESHIEEIEKKQVQMLDAQLINVLVKWTVTVPVPSAAFKQIVKLLQKVYDVNADILAPKHLEKFFTSILNVLKKRLRQQIVKLNIKPDDGPKRDIVNADIVFLKQNICSMHKIESLVKFFDDLWEI